MLINALWKTCGHRVIRRQTLDIVVFNVMWKTSGHRVIRRQTFDIVCDMENLLSPCDLSTDIVCDVENFRLCVIRQQTLCVMWKTCGHRVICQKTLCVVWKTY